MPDNPTTARPTATIQPVYVFTDLENYENPHSCIYPGNDSEPCLTCLLIDVLGEDRRDEALSIASEIGKRLREE